MIGKRGDFKTKLKNVLENLFKDFATIDLSSDTIRYFAFDEEFDASRDQMLLKVAGNNFDEMRVYTGNLVGTIYYNNWEINIGSRFCDAFLKYMIASSSGFLELENFGAASKDRNHTDSIPIAEWLLLYYWKIKLKQAFALGIYKSYVRYHEPLMTVRGRIDMNALARRPYHKQTIPCEYRDHSYDNAINSVIALALKKVFAQNRYFELLQDMYTIKKTYDEINTSITSFANTSKQKVTNPYYLIYEDIYELSLRILNDDFGNLGQNDEFSAFLFDISLLFEHHIRKMLIQNGFNLHSKNEKKFKIPNGVGENDVYPDIVIDHGNGKISIFDVKYKNFDFRSGVAREDRFQLVSYVALYSAEYEVVNCGFIYPRRIEKENDNYHKTQQLKIHKDKYIPFNIFFYHVTQCVDDDKYIKDQRDNDGKFIEIIKKIIQI